MMALAKNIAKRIRPIWLILSSDPPLAESSKIAHQHGENQGS